jgi:membrane-associated two-gene conflict system component 1 (EACC1)
VELDEIELELTPQHPTLDDERFARQVDDLVDALREDVGGISARAEPEPGTKGAVAQLVLALGSSGAIAAAVTVFKAWLARDKLRKIKIVVRTQGAAREVEITADTANVDELERLLVVARSKK